MTPGIHAHTAAHRTWHANTPFETSQTTRRALAGQYRQRHGTTRHHPWHAGLLGPDNFIGKITEHHHQPSKAFIGYEQIAATSDDQQRNPFFA